MTSRCAGGTAAFSPAGDPPRPAGWIGERQVISREPKEDEGPHLTRGHGRSRRAYLWTAGLHEEVSGPALPRSRPARAQSTFSAIRAQGLTGPGPGWQNDQR